MPTPDVFSTSLIQIAAFDLTANVHGMTYRGEPLVPFFKQIDAHTVELHITEDVDKADGAGYLRMPPICVDCALQISIDYEGGKPITIDQPAGTFSFGGKGKLTFALRLTEDLSEAYCTLTLPIAIETKSRRKADATTAQFLFVLLPEGIDAAYPYRMGWVYDAPEVVESADMSADVYDVYDPGNGSVYGPMIGARVTS
jgi:hypothetical protein